MQTSNVVDCIEAPMVDIVPKRHVVVAMKLFPCIETSVDPAAGPLSGDNDCIVMAC